jgi:hypothetical protein
VTAPDSLTALADEMGRLLLPLREAAQSPDRFRALMADLGWQADDIPQPVRDLAGGLTDIEEAVTRLAGGAVDAATVDSLLNAILRVTGDIDAIARAADAAIPPRLRDAGFREEFPGQVVEYLVVVHLERSHPRVAWLLELVGVIRMEYEPATPARPARMSRRIELPDLPRVLSDPTVLLEHAFGWGTPDLDHARLLRALDALLTAFGLYVSRPRPVLPADPADPSPPPPPAAPPSLSASLFASGGPAGAVGAGVAFVPLPQDGADLPGLALMPYAHGSIGRSFDIGGGWALTLESGLDLQGGLGILLRPDVPPRPVLGFGGEAPATSAQGMLSARLENEAEPGQPTLLLGSRDGSRAEVATMSVAAGLYVDARGGPEVVLEAELDDLALAIAPGAGDSFLRRLLPPDGLRARFDLALGVSSVRGLYFRGSSALDVRVPTHLEIGGLSFEAVTVAVAPRENSIDVAVGATVRAALGPLAVSIAGVGVSAELAFPGSGGNLGPVGAEIGFKPPTGLGLSIDGGGFRGGGFLGFDQANARYFGILQLQFQGSLALTAVGVLTTRLPGRTDGYSLLIAISTEFPPVQLGLGFTLNGVGGLLALNRTMRVDALREGVRDGSLGSILFPRDPVANADRIVSDLERVFPVQEGRFAFAPMARLGWGTPTLVTIDLGLLVEVPDPVRVALVGVLRAILPDEHTRLLVLQVNFLGVVDFQRRSLAFDASLFDSRLLTFSLSGDMAVRVVWGDQPNFLLSVGGFHPSYRPPPLDLPDLRRITVNLLPGDNPRLRLESYFAVTSNTVQFGSSIELYAGVAGFNVYGFLGFDVLFQFEPFHFQADVRGELALRRGETVLFGVSLRLTLEGPNPWRAAGRATFRIWIVSFDIDFDVTFGAPQVEPPPPSVDVLELLRRELAAPASWGSAGGTGRRLVRTRELEPGAEVVVDPSDVLRVSQRVVPLGIDIDRYGAARVEGSRRFEITRVRAGARELAVDETFDLYPPAQYVSLTQAEQLARPSFERMRSGVQVDAAEAIAAGTVVTRDMGYEQVLIDRAGTRRRLGWQLDDPVRWRELLRGSSVARSELAARMHLRPQPAVSVVPEEYAVVSTADLGTLAGTSRYASATEAAAAIASVAATDPGAALALQVVPAAEAL